MSLTAVLTLLLVVIVILLLCYVVLLVVERLFGPLDHTLKAILGVVVLLIILIYVLNHLGVVGLR